VSKCGYAGESPCLDECEACERITTDAQQARINRVHEAIALIDATENNKVNLRSMWTVTRLRRSVWNEKVSEWYSMLTLKMVREGHNFDSSKEEVPGSLIASFKELKRRVEYFRRNDKEGRVKLAREIKEMVSEVVSIEHANVSVANYNKRILDPSEDDYYEEPCFVIAMINKELELSYAAERGMQNWNLEEA
jgi:hypothetical protein